MRNAEEIIKVLEENYDLKNLNISDISQVFFNVMLENYFPNQDIDTLNFKIFEIEENEKSKSLYKYSYKNKLLMRGEKVFIIFEMNSDFFDSNSSEMIAKLILLRGITQEDHDSNSVKFQNYAVTLKEYEERELHKLFNF